jgi:hypothetical protein
VQFGHLSAFRSVRRAVPGRPASGNFASRRWGRSEACVICRVIRLLEHTQLGHQLGRELGPEHGRDPRPAANLAASLAVYLAGTRDPAVHLAVNLAAANLPTTIGRWPARPGEIGNASRPSTACPARRSWATEGPAGCPTRSTWAKTPATPPLSSTVELSAGRHEQHRLPHGRTECAARAWSRCGWCPGSSAVRPP